MGSSSNSRAVESCKIITPGKSLGLKTTVCLGWGGGFVLAAFFQSFPLVCNRHTVGNERCSAISRFGQEDVKISDEEISEEYIKNSNLFSLFGFGNARNPEGTSIDVSLGGVCITHFLRDVELLHDLFVHCRLPTFYLQFLILYNS